MNDLTYKMMRQQAYHVGRLQGTIKSLYYMQLPGVEIKDPLVFKQWLDNAVASEEKKANEYLSLT
jgi:hypothetical protein